MIVRLRNTAWCCPCLISDLPPICSDEWLNKPRARICICPGKQEPSFSSASSVTAKNGGSLLLPSTCGFLRGWIWFSPPRDLPVEQDDCPAGDWHTLPQGKVQASPVQAAMQRLAPEGTSFQPGPPQWLTYSLGQQLYEPLHISMLAHYCCLLFYRAPERCRHPGAGAGPWNSLTLQCRTRHFQKGGVFWRVYLLKLPGLCCGDSAGNAPGRR